MSKILEILTNPNPILRNTSIDTDVSLLNTKKYIELLDDMTLTMQKKDGVGLAAPQIGKNIRIIVISHNDTLYKMINPVINKRSWSKVAGEEGCLSVPNVFGIVSRNKHISCSYFDEKGKLVKLKASDMLARIIQHEIDHLDGVLFIDKAKKLNS